MHALVNASSCGPSFALRATEGRGRVGGEAEARLLRACGHVTTHIE